MTCGGDGLCRRETTDNCAAINDAGNDSRDANGLCFGSGFIRNFCIVPTDAPRMFGTATLSTSGANIACDATLLGSDGTTLCFIIGKTILITGTVRVNGLNPVVFLGTDSVTIDTGGSIDVASHAPQVGNYGAGGVGAPDCTAALALGGSDDAMMTSGGGGAGGSFLGFGGNGGTGIAATGGARGSVVPPLTTVRGGCPGGGGGNGTAGSGGRGGHGGGAVYLLTGGSLIVRGRINASGAGGTAPTATGGGGGGGTGGFIGLDAKTYVFSNALMIAMGGAGASGATPSVSGVQGYEASTTTTAPGPTPGGSGAGSGGVGGSFAAGGTGGNGGAGGGGGGGGSTGFIGVAGLAGQIPPGAMYAPMPAPM
jgi:hypothetical protein